MVYAYRCPTCDHEFDVIKRHTEMDHPEICERCKTTAIREFMPQRLHLVHTKVQDAEYNPGLGCITKNRQDRAEICKKRGIEEIGNEKPDKIHEHFEKVREEKREKAWADADKGWVGSDG